MLPAHAARTYRWSRLLKAFQPHAPQAHQRYPLEPGYEEQARTKASCLFHHGALQRGRSFEFVLDEHLLGDSRLMGATVLEKIVHC